jgi:hypothetical protein
VARSLSELSGSPTSAGRLPQPDCLDLPGSYADLAGPIIVDCALYRDLVKDAIKRTHAELESKATSLAAEKKAARANARPADPLAVAKRERDAQLRRAHRPGARRQRRARRRAHPSKTGQRRNVRLLAPLAGDLDAVDAPHPSMR